MKRFILLCLLVVFITSCQRVTPQDVPDDPYASLANWQRLTAAANPRLVPVFWKETADCYFGLLEDPSNSQLVTSFYYRKPLTGSMSHGVDFFDLSGRPLNWNPGPFFSLKVKRETSWGLASKEGTTSYVIGHYYGKEALLSRLGGVVVQITDPQGHMISLQITRGASNHDWTMKTTP